MSRCAALGMQKGEQTSDDSTLWLGKDIVTEPALIACFGTIFGPNNFLDPAFLQHSGYGSIPINTIFRGMNIHLPAILMFTRGTRFWPTATCWSFGPACVAQEKRQLLSRVAAAEKGEKASAWPWWSQNWFKRTFGSLQYITIHYIIYI